MDFIVTYLFISFWCVLRQSPSLLVSTTYPMEYICPRSTINQFGPPGPSLVFVHNVLTYPSTARLAFSGVEYHM